MHRVLHVERSTFFQKIIRDILRPQGYEVDATNTIAGALDLWKQGKPDVILCGMELEDGRGQELIEALNGAGSSTPFIIITSSESLSLRQELFSLGVADYLIKQDINAERLAAYLNRMTDPDPVLRKMQNLSIAVLDDSQFEIQVIRSIFKLNGIKNPDTFNRAEDLLGTPRAYDLYLIDLVLPGMSGEEVVTTLRATHPEAMIIVASSINHAKTVAHVLDSGANDYITKPFESQLFMARIRATVRTFQLVAENACK